MTMSGRKATQAPDSTLSDVNRAAVEAPDLPPTPRFPSRMWLVRVPARLAGDSPISRELDDIFCKRPTFGSHWMGNIAHLNTERFRLGEHYTSRERRLILFFFFSVLLLQLGVISLMLWMKR